MNLGYVRGGEGKEKGVSPCPDRSPELGILGTSFPTPIPFLLEKKKKGGG
jgi:hypothetical protein